MFNGVENLIKNWDDFNAEFKESVTLRDKAMLIPMIYLSWDLCDDTYWSGTSLTQWLGPTPRRYDVKQLEHVLFIFMYLYSCTVTCIFIFTTGKLIDSKSFPYCLVQIFEILFRIWFSAQDYAIAQTSWLFYFKKIHLLYENVCTS